MSVTKDEAAYIAKLANLNFSEDELVSYTHDLNEMLEYVSQLQAVDTSSVEPLTHPISSEPWMRRDELRPSVSRETALKNAPQTDNEYFIVPKVIKQ
ncbi:MAG: Asp-tRNA(Asn)/Glu-tRNA(Gln) amidotransferase subunit GatC [Ignavibacteria bacterium]|nr:Asp-tRNA(Asn)/Glu-tRNA(Gln) amidotransferase subunit GatC [Ignavibacteria bacterium]